MQLNTTNVILTLLGVTLVLCFILTIMDKLHYNNIETFDPVVDAITAQLQNETPDQLKNTIKTLQQRLIDYGYAPNLNNYVTKTSLGPNDGKCLVATADDRDKYISKSDVPAPGPRIDLSQYVKKSSIPPATVCPPAPEIDYSAYVKKSTLPPNTKCPPCIAPKVKVSAGLCREPPPCPACPEPNPCPEKRCPEPAPCPDKRCPEPAPCPVQSTKTCDEIRYIKVPTIITKTITIDNMGNVVSQNIDSGNIIPTQEPEQIQELQESQVVQYSQPTIPTQVQNSLMNSIFGSTSVTQAALMPSTTYPSTTYPMINTIPNITLAQTFATVSNNHNNNHNNHNNHNNNNNNNNNHSFCPPPDLNSEFRSYGIYGR